MSRLWKETDSRLSAGYAVALRVDAIKDNVNHQVASRGARAVNALRNAELRVLKGQRSGEVYRKPHTKTATYTASAPGEPPARRTGSLRLHWDGDVKFQNNSRGGVSSLVRLESQEAYSVYLENGTNGTANMKPRPFVDKIIEKAKPEIERIYKEPYV